MQTLLTTIVLLFGINSTGFTSSNDRLENLFKENIVKAKQGDARAQATIGLLYAAGEGVEQNDKKAVEWYRNSAKQGDALAQSLLGEMYAKGKGVTKNNKKAVEWYRKSAEQGYSQGQLNLGIFYYQGKITLKDTKKGTLLIKKSAEQGNSVAQLILGQIYFLRWADISVPRTKPNTEDFDNSIKWYAKAAEQGEPEAQERLAFFYASGLGLEKNLSKAKELIEKAFENGDSNIRDSARKTWDTYELWNY